MCVCVVVPGTEVLWVLSPHRASTHFAMKSEHFVSCLFVMKVKASWLSAGMITHKFNYQFDYLHKYLFHEKGRDFVTYGIRRQVRPVADSEAAFGKPSNLHISRYSGILDEKLIFLKTVFGNTPSSS